MTIQLTKILLVTAISISASAHAQDTRYTLTSTLQNMDAWAINERGQVAGWGSSTYVAQLYTPGVGIEVLTPPTGVTSSIGYHLNEAGQVGGLLSYSSTYWGPTYQSFVYTPGVTQPYQLIAGYSAGIDYQLQENGTLTRLTSAQPLWAVNNTTVPTAAAGQFTVGYSYFNSRNSYGAAWRQNPDGSFTTIGQLFADSESQSYGVNGSGATVGRVVPGNAGGPMWAFVYGSDNQAYNLFNVTDAASRTGWMSFSSAQDITEDGRITGWGIYSDPLNGSTSLSSFVLTPIAAVPEASSYYLFAFGLLIIAAKGKFLRRTVVAKPEA